MKPELKTFIFKIALLLVLEITVKLWHYKTNGIHNNYKYTYTQLKIPFLDNQAWVFGANVHKECKEGEWLHGDLC